MFSAMLQGLYTLEDFQADLNKLERESSSEVLSSILRWNLLKRRRLAKQARADAHRALTKDERRRSKMHDRQATGWAMLMHWRRTHVDRSGRGCGERLSVLTKVRDSVAR
jgi:hypothetical protein